MRLKKNRNQRSKATNESRKNGVKTDLSVISNGVGSGSSSEKLVHLSRRTWKSMKGRTVSASINPKRRRRGEKGRTDRVARGVDGDHEEKQDDEEDAGVGVVANESSLCGTRRRKVSSRRRVGVVRAKRKSNEPSFHLGKQTEDIVQYRGQLRMKAWRESSPKKT